MMTSDDAQILVDRIEALRHPCDLDLLVFFVKHPRTLMASEQLASFMGYDVKQLAMSLDVLLEAGLVNRSQTRAHVARMYVLATDGVHGGWLPSLVTLASTRTGRLALIRALRRRSPPGPRAQSKRAASPGTSLPRPSLVRRGPNLSPASERQPCRRGVA